MVKLNDSPQQVKYTTRSFAPARCKLDFDNPFIIEDVPPEAIERFDYQRGNLSRQRYLNELLDLADSVTDFNMTEYTELDY